MFLDILLLFQHTAAACTGCTGCLLAWFLLPFLLGLLLGWWIWGAYKSLLEEKETKILSLNTQLTEREKEYMDLKYKLESDTSISTKLKDSLASCQAERSTLLRQLREAETVKIVEETPEPLALTETIVEETPVEEVVVETPIVAAAPLAVASIATAIAVAPTEETPKDKEDDYLPCKAYIGHPVNDSRNNIAFFKHENGQFYFVLYGEDGEVRLRSEGFPTTKERDQELSGVNRFKDEESHYKRVTKGKYFMDVLYDETGREVGRSCLQKIEEPVVEEVATPVIEAAAPVMAVAAVAPVLAETDKEDDYLPCKEYIGHKINDKRNNIALFKHDNGQFYFVLYKANGEVQLRSEGFRTSQERDKELSGVIRFKEQAANYKRIQKGKYYMDALYDNSGIEVGRSCLQKVAEPEEPIVVEKVEPEVVERQIIKVRRTVNISGLEDLDGIGVVAQTKLKALGLGSMTALAAADEAALTNHFAGTDYNWRYWWMQAKYATSGDWAKYYSFQASKGEGVKQELTPTPIEAEEVAPAPIKAVPTQPKEVRSTPAGITRTIRTVKPVEPDSKDAYALYFTTATLQVIEGVGPKIEKILNNGGYTSLADVADASYDDLKKLLSNAGPRFRIHDPKSWSRQAQLASQNKWNDLIDYQKFLNKTTAGEAAFSKVEKLMNRQQGYTKTEATDLKIIEGIGPKIEALLKAGGIYNWMDLSNASIDKLKLILQNAGSRYRLADPTTWSTQAGMAVRKEWTKLKEYQDLLQGGKDLS